MGDRFNRVTGYQPPRRSFWQNVGDSFGGNRPAGQSRWQAFRAANPVLDTMLRGGRTPGQAWEAVKPGGITPSEFASRDFNRQQPLMMDSDGGALSNYTRGGQVGNNRGGPIGTRTTGAQQPAPSAPQMGPPEAPPVQSEGRRGSVGRAPDTAAGAARGSAGRGGGRANAGFSGAFGAFSGARQLANRVHRSDRSLMQDT